MYESNILFTLYNYDDHSEKIDLYVHPTQSFAQVVFALRKRLNCSQTIQIEIYEIQNYYYYRKVSKYSKMMTQLKSFFSLFVCIRKNKDTYNNYKKLSNYDVLPHQTKRRIQGHEQIQQTY